jgi:hypothetical protein
MILSLKMRMTSANGFALPGTSGKVSGKARVRVTFQQKTVREFGVRILGLKRAQRSTITFGE